jgi:hypothetical protein
VCSALAAQAAKVLGLSKGQGTGISRGPEEWFSFATGLAPGLTRGVLLVVVLHGFEVVASRVTVGGVFGAIKSLLVAWLHVAILR